MRIRDPADKPDAGEQIMYIPAKGMIDVCKRLDFNRECKPLDPVPNSIRNLFLPVLINLITIRRQTVQRNISSCIVWKRTKALMKKPETVSPVAARIAP